MTHHLSEKQGRVVFYVSIATAVLSLVAVFGFVALQAYTRWNVNQEFTFLGGLELEVLTASAFVLLIALLYFSRSRHSE